MVCTLEDELVVLDYEWCLVFSEGCCIGLFVLYVVLLLPAECLPPFIMAFFFRWRELLSLRYDKGHFY